MIESDVTSGGWKLILKGEPRPLLNKLADIIHLIMVFEIISKFI